MFASGIEPPDDSKRQYDPANVDLRLKAGSAAIGAGQLLPGLNDDAPGKSPDLGAYEFGGSLPQYGPRRRNEAWRRLQAVICLAHSGVAG